MPHLRAGAAQEGRLRGGSAARATVRPPSLPAPSCARPTQQALSFRGLGRGEPEESERGREEWESGSAGETERQRE
eukprot:343868-Rhodomonas_salina.1